METVEDGKGGKKYIALIVDKERNLSEVRSAVQLCLTEMM